MRIEENEKKNRNKMEESGRILGSETFSPRKAKKQKNEIEENEKPEKNEERVDAVSSAGGEDGFGIPRVVHERVAEKVEGSLVSATLIPSVFWMRVVETLCSDESETTEGSQLARRSDLAAFQNSGGSVQTHRARCLLQTGTRVAALVESEVGEADGAEEVGVFRREVERVLVDAQSLLVVLLLLVHVAERLRTQD